MRITHAYTEVGVQVLPAPGVRVTHGYLEVAINPNETAPPPIIPQAMPEARKPLVIVGGQISQLSDSDRLDAQVSEVDIAEASNGNASAITIGQPVYVVSAGQVDLAQANAQLTAKVFGLVSQASIASTATGNLQTSGILEATTGEWDVVTGQTGGLTPGGCYYLDPNVAGRLTTVVPNTDGQFVARVGYALSTTQLDVHPVLVTAL